MDRLLFLILWFALSSPLLGQQSYYVPGSALNLRAEPNTESDVLHKLKMYDNLRLVEEAGDWLKVSFGDKEGYVFRQFVKKGRAVVSTYSERYGAICRDGSRSSATGRGACSHHGGVSSWLTKDRRSVRIEDQ